MSVDLDHAESLLGIAKKDQKALHSRTDPNLFAVETFGFHAQQAVEKALKAWMSAEGINYPKSHDITHLKQLLSDAGCDLTGFDDIDDLNVFAVQYRYEAYDEDDEELDRADAISEVDSVISHIEAIIVAKRAASSP